MRYAASVSAPSTIPSLHPDDARAAALAPLLARAGQVAMARFRAGTTRTKADGSQVTDGDLAAHDVLVQGLTDAFPGEAVFSEEDLHTHDPEPGAPAWYVDPIDGTSAYAEGLAHWGPTVARVVDDRFECGAFWMPRLGDAYFAVDGGGAWHNGTRIHAEPTTWAPRLRTLCVPSRAHRAFPIAWPGKIRALGSTAAHLSLVAHGGTSAAFIPMWSMWDVGLGILMVREAGRAVVDLAGRPFDAVHRPAEPFLAAEPALVPELVELLRRARESSARSV